jgi:hypothetical protein
MWRRAWRFLHLPLAMPHVIVVHTLAGDQQTNEGWLHANSADSTP